MSDVKSFGRVVTHVQPRRRKGKRRGRGGRVSGLFRMTTTNLFRLTEQTADITTDGSGVAKGFASADPSGGSGSTWTATEWSPITNLFSEVRLVWFRVHISFAPSIPTTESVAPVFAISSVLNSVASAPTSINTVMDNADSKLWQTIQQTRLVAPFFTLRPRQLLNFAVTTTPNPGSYAGCPGSIQWYGAGHVASTTIARVICEGVYEFRSRI